jgi:hypothetical protein
MGPVCFNVRDISRLTADQHSAPVDCECWICLPNGRGSRLDLVQSAKYCTLAADRNMAKAQFRNAVCLTRGKGISASLVLYSLYAGRTPRGLGGLEFQSVIPAFCQRWIALQGSRRDGSTLGSGGRKIRYLTRCPGLNRNPHSAHQKSNLSVCQVRVLRKRPILPNERCFVKRWLI